MSVATRRPAAAERSDHWPSSPSGCIAAAFPFAWTVWGSFKVEADFFSRQSWWNAIEGTRTQAQTGSAFTARGYEGAWVDERVLEGRDQHR